MNNSNCWVCVDSLKIGTWKQAESLASAWIGEYTKKPIKLPAWCRWMPPRLFEILPKFLKNIAIENLGKDFPNILIAAGRQAILVALALRHQSKTVVLMNPGIAPNYFDVVIAPIHDQIAGKNVICTQGAIHNIDPEKLIFPKNLEKFFAPRIAVLLGGNSIHGTYTNELAIKMANDLKNLATSNAALVGANLIITPSRRTPLKWLEIFEQNLHGLNHWIWDQKTHNPYPNLLKGADVIVVCQDSISMASEACVMGKPVLIYPTGIKKQKFKRFYDELFKNSYAQPFKVDATIKDSPVLNELNSVVEKLKSKNLIL